MSSYRGQGSLEYLLLIAGAVLVGAVVLIVVLGATSTGGNILENNLSQITLATQTKFDNTHTPLAAPSLSAIGGERTVTLSYDTPGADSVILVQEKESTTTVNSIGTPELFSEFLDSTPKPLNVTVFPLFFFEDTADSQGLDNCSTYYFRLRACKTSGECLVSDVASATPEPAEGC